MAGRWSPTAAVKVKKASISHARTRGRGHAERRSRASARCLHLIFTSLSLSCVIWGETLSPRLRSGSARQHRNGNSGRSKNRCRAARYGSSRERARPVAAVLSVALAVALAGLVLASRSSASTGPSASPCTGLMSGAKCSAVQQAARRLPVQGPSPSAARPAPGIPGVTRCGPAFFAAAEASRLTSAFGLISCFRLTGQDQWILLGSGTSASAPRLAGTPGGAVVAVERCRAGDATCLNPDATHSFGSFMVARPPDPLGEPLELQAVAGPSVLLLSNARCGLFSFDVSSLRWYRGTSSAVHALLASPGQQQPLAAAPAMTGSQALGAPPPAGPPAACPPGPGQ